MYALKNKKGFTLIEIVIVLAIAALILAGVLIAVSGAQTSRRDTQRKDDAGKVASYMEQWASNHGGAYPATAAELATFRTTYVTTNNLNDPSSGAAYAMGLALTAPAAGTINFSINATCNGTVGAAGGGNRRYALIVGLEQGGSACYGN